MTFYEYFIQNHPHIVDNMRNVEHGITTRSPYHLEGDIWTHTNMVYAISKLKENDLLSTAALLHDVGKAYCYTDNDETDRRLFAGHEGRSFYQSYWPLVSSGMYDRSQIETILLVVGLHGRLYGQPNPDWSSFHVLPDQTRSLLLSLIECDVAGRVVATEKDKRYKIGEEERKMMMEHQSIKPDPNQSKLTLLVGPPGVGKSTYRSKLDSTNVIISRDDLLQLMYPAPTYNESWKLADHKEVDQELLSSFNRALKANLNIVVDMTNMSKKSRRKFINPAKQHDYYSEAVLFCAPVETMYNNRLSESKTIPKSVIDGMMNRFTIPLGDEVNSLKFNHYKE